MSLYAEEDSEFHKEEQETQGLLKALITKQSLSRTAGDVDFLAAARQQNKASLRKTDNQLDLLKDRIMQTRVHPFRLSADDLNNMSNHIRSSPIATDDDLDYWHNSSRRNVFFDKWIKLFLMVGSITSDCLICEVIQLAVTLSRIPSQLFTDHDAQPPPLVGIDPLLLSQPQTLHGHRHGGQLYASGSTMHQSRHIPPANLLISHDNASYFEDQYDASTNPYVGMHMMLMPPPWQIPSQPQVEITPQLLGYGQLPLPINHQFQSNFGYNSSSVGVQMPSHGYAIPPLSPGYSSSFVGVQMPSHGYPMPPLQPLPPSQYPPSDVMRDDQVSQTRNDTMNMEPTPIVPSQAHLYVAPPQPFLAEFIPDFTHPVFSQDGDVLLPPDVEDECLIASTENPEDDSTFRFYRGVNNWRGRKRKHVAEHTDLLFDDKNSKHRRIVKSAKREITKHALNAAALTKEADRVTLAEKKLEVAAQKVLGTEHGKEWVSHNSGTLYMILSEPFKNIMKMCKKRAFELVLDGFDLRLSIWLTDSELAHQEAMIADLIDDSIFPPRFLTGSGTGDEQYFLKNNVSSMPWIGSSREYPLPVT
ncbi:hypothetical protein EV702DRAFT_1050819 [Suillus placidus]|uniref:Uncharacterized protein n=1 Tax=Suillus placidus TaxID=48579 RepID=A0A9P6ZJ71_9AGAM|nr:hypothetical protein EV702DRAFT_1050819 [Suillus placidus]